MPIRPQDGPQLTFLSSSADIAIYGGSAGGGKTWALLMEPLRHIHNAKFGAVFFRRTTPQIRNEGGLWDESVRLYTLAGADPKEHDLWWRFPSGAAVTFAHLEHDKTVLNYQGSQIPLLNFDELTHFTEKQFWYMLSRNRSMCGVKPYVRATCNPDADSWVRKFIAWWIDPVSGLAIAERGGVLRWFVRIGDTIIWADKPEELDRYTAPDENGVQKPIPPKSVTFIPAKLTDNKALMAADPGYLANLMALPTVDRERLLGGNWNIRPAAGLYFQRGWCEVVDAIPAGTKFARGWDLAATPKTETNDPDWTTGTKLGRCPDGRYIVADHVYVRDGPLEIETLLKNTASRDGRECDIHLPQDPAQAGKTQAQAHVRLLAGYSVHTKPITGNKVTRFSPFSAQAKARNVVLLRGDWNDRWFNNLEGFPESKHDDDADSTAEAFNGLHEEYAGRHFLEMVREQNTSDAKVKDQAVKDEQPKVEYSPGSMEWMKAQMG